MRNGPDKSPCGEPSRPAGFARNPCGPQETTVEVVRPPGVIPHNLPGKNDMLSQFAITYGLPFEATRGYAEAYPEYMEKLKTLKPTTKVR